MTSAPTRSVRHVLGALTLALAIGVGPSTSAASPCEASVHGELTRVEPKDLVTAHTFTVNATTLEPCAVLRFTLFTTERVSKTKVKVVKTKSQLRLRGGSASRILHYDMPRARELVKWEVKLTGCERCEP